MSSADDVVALDDRVFQDQRDLVIGIPSWNNSRTIGHVTATALEGIRSHFPDSKALVLNSDGGSADGTRRVFLDAARTRDIRAQRSRASISAATVLYKGIPGKGSAFRAIFEIAKRVEAKAIVVLDSDLRSVEPFWIETLAGPVLHGKADFVAPLYRRHKFDGTITNSIVFPLANALFGGEVRQPIGGDFGVSGTLVSLYSERDVWHSDVARFGVDIWMTVTALAEGFRVAQAHLGAKVHDPKDPGLHLSDMMVQVVGTLFGLAETFQETWIRGIRSEPVPTFGEPKEVETDAVKPDPARMLAAFRRGISDLSSFYAEFLNPELLRRLHGIASSQFPVNLDDETWIDTVISFLVAYRSKTPARTTLLAALTPIYLGRVASFIGRNLDASPEEVERQVRDLAVRFDDARPRLAKQWASGPGRLEKGP